MAVVIPTRTDAPHYELEVDLDGVTFKLELRWNARAEGWFLTISDSAGTALLQGIRVVTDFPLTARYRIAGLPSGELIAVDTTTQQMDPGLDELGGRVLLLYFPADELPAAFLG